jgi:peptide subunit release factor 1 (eRF1)
MFATKQIVKSLSQMSSVSGGTSLVTLYIPSNAQIGLTTSKLVAELSTASNIKDRSVRNDTITALKSSIALLKSSNLHTAHENGLVLCSGIDYANDNSETCCV